MHKNLIWIAELMQTFPRTFSKENEIGGGKNKTQNNYEINNN